MRIKELVILAALVAAGWLLLADTARAEVLVDEQFLTDTSSTNETLRHYPGFSLVPSGSTADLRVIRGILRFKPASGSDALILRSGYQGDLRIRADIGGSSVAGYPPGSWGVGLVLNAARLVLSPGFREAGVPGVRGAFRIEAGQNWNMTADTGFVPEEGRLHQLELIVCGARSGNVYVTFGPRHHRRQREKAFHAWLQDTTYCPGDPIGFAAQGAGTGVGAFDNLEISKGEDVEEVCKRDGQDPSPPLPRCQGRSPGN